MGIRASAMRDKVRTITVGWEDESLEVGIRPGRYTGALMERITEASREAEAAEAAGDVAAAQKAVDLVAEATAEVIAWWDVLDEDGERLPVDAETLNSLPMSFVQHVMSQAGQAIRPPANRG